MKPGASHTVGVVGAALSIWGAAKGRAAARAKDPCSTERLVRSVTAASSLFRERRLALASGGHSSPPSIGRCGIRHLTTPVKKMTNGQRAGPPRTERLRPPREPPRLHRPGIPTNRARSWTEGWRRPPPQIGRASCRERVEISVVAVALKKKRNRESWVCDRDVEKS